MLAHPGAVADPSESRFDMSNSTTSRVCWYCGDPIERRGSRGPLPKYCGEKCKHTKKNELAKERGVYAAKLAESREKNQKRREENARPCPYCGTLMTSPWRKQCGAPDCKRKFNADRAREFFKKFKEDNGVAYKTVKLRFTRTCLGCGQTWEACGPKIKYCSNTCQAEYEYGAERGTRVRGYIPDTVRFSIYLRDGWVCRLCDEPVDRFAVHPKSLAPTIDHVIPVSRDGTDDEYNLRLAHSSCNTRRNVTPDEVWFSRST
jgi:hypothetical protein